MGLPGLSLEWGSSQEYFPSDSGTHYGSNEAGTRELCYKKKPMIWTSWYWWCSWYWFPAFPLSSQSFSLIFFQFFSNLLPTPTPKFGGSVIVSCAIFCVCDSQAMQSSCIHWTGDQAAEPRSSFNAGTWCVLVGEGGWRTFLWAKVPTCRFPDLKISEVNHLLWLWEFSVIMRANKFWFMICQALCKHFMCILVCLFKLWDCHFTFKA